MSSDHATDVLADLAALAREHEWGPLTQYIDSLPKADDPSILVLVSRAVDPATAKAAIAMAADATALRVLALGDLAEPEQTMLGYNRVAVVHSCGGLLSGAETEVAVTALARPTMSSVLLLTDVEVLGSTEDWHTLQRRLWRLLVADGTSWVGQDSWSRGIALYGDLPADHPLAAQVGQARDRVTTWLERPAVPPAQLDRQRASRALSLAEDAVRAGSAVAEETAHLRGRAQLAGRASREGRAKVIEQLRALDRTTRTVLTQALSTLEQQLIAGLPAFVAANRASGGADMNALFRYVDSGLRAWWLEREPLMSANVAAHGRDLEAVYNDVEWDLINRAIGATERHPRYRPSAFGLRFDTVRHATGPTAAVPFELAGAPARRGSVGPALLGGVVGATVGVFLGGLLGSVFWGAAGAAGGLVVSRRIGRGGAREGLDGRVQSAARTLISRQIAAASAAVPDAIQTALRPIEAGMIAEFDAVDRELAEVSGQLSDTPGSARTTDVADVVRRLRERLRV